MLIQTENSIYEIDSEHNRFRKLSDITENTQRTGKTGAWRTFTEVKVEVGSPCLIIWYYEDGVAKSTMTSIVKEIKN